MTGAARFRFGGANLVPGAASFPVGLFHRILLAVWFLAQEPQKYIKDHQRSPNSEVKCHEDIGEDPQWQDADFGC